MKRMGKIKVIRTYYDLYPFRLLCSQHLKVANGKNWNRKIINKDAGPASLCVVFISEC